MQNVVLPGGLKFIAFDNASTDGSGDALRKRGVEVVSHANDVGRVGNWTACVDHFVASEAPWMKWLFAGDVLDPDFLGRQKRPFLLEPRARIILGDYVHVAADGQAPTSSTFSSVVGWWIPRRGCGCRRWATGFTRQSTRCSIARRSPMDSTTVRLCGGPVYFCMTAASRVPTLYWPHNLGNFMR